jgi:hypothetical protein
MLEGTWVETGVTGAKSLGVRTLAVMASPLFGVIALAGVIGWELWKAKKDDRELEAKKAAS